MGKTGKNIDEVHKNKTESKTNTELNNRAEESMVESEEKFRALLENIQEGYFEVDLTGKFTFLNDSVCHILGYSREELIGINSKNFTDENDVEKVFQAYKEVYKTGKALKDFNWHIIRKDGSQKYIEGSISLRKDLSGQPIGFRVIANDFTERKQMEETLRRNEEKYRSILEHIQEAYFEVDLAGNFTFFNKSFCRILGYAEEEMMGMNYREYTDKEQAKIVFQVCNKVYVTGEPAQVFDWQFIRKDGSKIYVEESISLKKNRFGELAGFRGMVRDVTERRLAEDQIRKSEDKYRTILENIEDGYYEVDLTGNFTFFNDAMCLILGYSRDDLMGMNNCHYTDKEYSKKLFEAFNKVYKTGEPSKGFDWRIIRKDGTERCIEASASLLKDSLDKPIGFRGILRDITDRKNAEDNLRHSEEKYRNILESMEEGYFEVDLTGNLTFFNDTICRILGYTREELVGMNNRRYTDKEDFERVFQAYNKVYKTGEPSRGFEWQIIRKDGNKRYIEGSISLHKDSSGKPSGFRGVVRDITERRKIEEKLRGEEQRFRALAEQSSDIILLVNRKGVITYENSAVSILGINADNRIGENVFERVHHDDMKIVYDSFIILFNDKNAPVQKAEIRLRNADGSWHTFEAMGSNLVRDNVIEAAIVNLRDITERKRADEKLRQTLDSLRKAVGTTIQVMISAVEMRDPYTAGHQSRAANVARAIATEMGLSHDKIDAIRMAGTIHDIGKLSIPSEILTKPSKLTDIEYSIIKEHSQSGYEVLKSVESNLPLAEIVYQHHERMNGTGYPRNLKGDEILLEARIMAVADVVEAMASHRPYRASLGTEKALEEIEKNKGILYDEAVADACLRLFREKNYHLP